MENNSTPNNHLKTLLDKYINNTCSKGELEQLFALAKEESNELFEAMKFHWDKTKEEATPGETRGDVLFNSLMDKVKENVSVVPLAPTEQLETKVYQIGGGWRRVLVRMAAAAAVLFVLTLTTVWLLKNDQQEIAQNDAKKPAVNDMIPGRDKAILTLANGGQIVLDTASNGALAQQGNIKVIKIGGQLSYNAEGSSKEVLYNTITTPKGGQYQLELADGSKVWLNAASSLRFPTSFTGKERTVELTGEAYFEVTHNSAMPFHVKVGEMDVQDLGTAFNVDAYGDESNLKTTLVEGSVIVASKGLKRAAVLKPGQQAVLGKEALSVNKDVDVDEVTAWKNGQFIFNNATLEQIMNQIARWYDAEIVYRGTKQQKRFSGIVSRKSNLSEVLNIMKQAGVKFEIEGKKITVLQ